MDQAATQTIATFTGTLLRREKAASTTLVQLVFREDGKDWLCLSTNPAVTKLSLGKKYCVEGIFKSNSKHSFILEPHVSPLARKIWSHKVIITVVVCMVIILAVAVGAKALTGSSPQHVVIPTVQTAKPSQVVQALDATTVDPTPTATTGSSASLAQPTTPRPKTTKSTSSAPTITPVTIVAVPSVVEPVETQTAETPTVSDPTTVETGIPPAAPDPVVVPETPADI